MVAAATATDGCSEALLDGFGINASDTMLFQLPFSAAKSQVLRLVRCWRQHPQLQHPESAQITVNLQELRVIAPKNFTHPGWSDAACLQSTVHGDASSIAASSLRASARPDVAGDCGPIARFRPTHTHPDDRPWHLPG